MKMLYCNFFDFLFSMNMHVLRAGELEKYCFTKYMCVRVCVYLVSSKSVKSYTYITDIYLF